MINKRVSNMKQKKLIKDFLLNFLLTLILILFLSSSPLFAQENDTLEKIIKGNEFLLKSDLELIFGLSYTPIYFYNSIPSFDLYLFYIFDFSYKLFDWLNFNIDLEFRISTDGDNCVLPYEFYSEIYFDKIFKSLPFQWDLRIGFFPYDLSLSENFNKESSDYWETVPFYYGIAPFYIQFTTLSIVMDIKWWLLDISTGFFGIDQSAAFVKGIFSFYDFAYLGVTGLMPININQSGISSTLFIELAMTTGLFDIMLYLLPTTYHDALLDEDLSTFCFGANIKYSFTIANSHNLVIKLFGDYISPNATNAFTLIDYLNEISIPSNYTINQKHPSRAGIGIEYNGNFNNVLKIVLASFVYYNFSTNSVNFNAYLKTQFYYFFTEINYFPFYYPVILLNIFSISAGLNFSF